jgi:hypothetical protein
MITSHTRVLSGNLAQGFVVFHDCKRQEDSGSSLKKVSLLACGRVDAQKEDDEERLARMPEQRRAHLRAAQDMEAQEVKIGTAEHQPFLQF